MGLFGIRGLVRGTLWQVFGLIGVLLGLVTAGWIARWVGAYWHDAQPAVLFLVLRWLVAALGGLAVASLLGWWGESLGKAAREGPAGWLDRAGGFVFGCVLGGAVAAVMMLALSIFPWPGLGATTLSSSRLPVPILRGAISACDVAEPLIPGSGWLGRRFIDAKQRATQRMPASDV